MAVPDMIARTASRCQARPLAARPGYREDMLCASEANSVVRYADVDVPVCKMHEATYARWGVSAWANASERWGWGVWTLEVAAALAIVAQLIVNGP
jgi:hypothetical protein